MSPAVHHLPLGQTDATVLVTVACTGGDEAVTVTVVPSAVPIEEPSVASLTFWRAASRSATGAETAVPSAVVAEVAMVILRVMDPLLRERARRMDPQGLESEMSEASTLYCTASAAITAVWL